MLPTEFLDVSVVMMGFLVKMLVKEVHETRMQCEGYSWPVVSRFDRTAYSCVKDPIQTLKEHIRSIGEG